MMDIRDQVELLMTGTEYGDASLAQAMADELHERLENAQREGRPLRVYCGYDPRTTDLHLGHTITMRKLRQFQELGHEVTFLIGTYTSLIGDPSDKDKLRPQLSPEEVDFNAKTYADQALRILDSERTKVDYNARWLSELSFADLIKLASNFTLQQFLSRDNFRQRWDQGEAVYLHETFYSIMQGYDAYALKADVQVGGTDQLFNIVTAARKVMAFLGERPNIAIIMGILPGTDGEIRMSKSLGNHIPLNSTAADMYGKVMALPDKAMGVYFRLLTRWTPDRIRELEAGLENDSLHPRDVKMSLAKEIVDSYYSTEEAAKAEADFIQVFQQGDLPDEMPEFKLEGDLTVLDVLHETGLVASRSEGRRMLSQRGVRLDGDVLQDPNQSFPGRGVLQVGKRRFVRVI